MNDQYLLVSFIDIKCPMAVLIVGKVETGVQSCGNLNKSRQPLGCASLISTNINLSKSSS